MTPEIVTLQDFVSWGFLGLGLLLLWLVGMRILKARRQRSRQRKKRRHCVQCGLWQELEEGKLKFGSCSACGGVTTRGRSRKLG